MPLIEINCQTCGGSFKVHRYRKDTAKFCSYSCAAKSRSNAFKTGEIIKPNGYVMIWINGKYVYKHRWMIEQLYGRKLKRKEVVHHRDGNKQNNTYANFKVMNKKKHDSKETIRRWKTDRNSFIQPNKERCNAPCIDRHCKDKPCQRFKPCHYHPEV